MGVASPRASPLLLPADVCPHMCTGAVRISTCSVDLYDSIIIHQEQPHMPPPVQLIVRWAERGKSPPHPISPPLSPSTRALVKQVAVSRPIYAVGDCLAHGCMHIATSPRTFPVLFLF
eukprot:GGOE01043335.1.p3 GENE.GGOE01043335.1~~GGOE01043335.1.p3  ORF type:complete len:118 (-),score=0.98 GGOE01043335.1:3-356(-)